MFPGAHDLAYFADPPPAVPAPEAEEGPGGWWILPLLTLALPVWALAVRAAARCLGSG